MAEVARSLSDQAFYAFVAMDAEAREAFAARLNAHFKNLGHSKSTRWHLASQLAEQNEPVNSAKRPATCREQLRAEGKPYPKSGCAVCKTGGLTGCPYRAAPAVLEGMVPTHRHKKRGSEYALIGIGKMQTERWIEPAIYPKPGLADMRKVAIYRSIDDGSLWARPCEEFEDGRFEKIGGQSNG